MENSGGLAKKERKAIFKLFLDNTKLKFSEIEKALNIRSNMVSYHLDKMQEQGLIEKIDDFYYLTKNAEKYIPILQQITGEQLGPLPVIIIALVNKDKILLIKRNKRPYKEYWSLIGGKMLLEEDFKQASVRQIKEKSNLDADFLSINSVLHEKVKGDDIIKHSFILFFTQMSTKDTNFKESEHGELKWVKIEEIDSLKVIPSDLWLIKNKLNCKIKVKSADMSENQGELIDFKIIA
jgi:ADP-ribose pyrophosphatase YjhB (NUDIX family)